ncbi:hypothetical protein G5V57_11310 [Nordella sp. HKS 07]|uniref:hypothetical protein n=1 Tax=Nordella sp. HKS 07 TaxID=2712222 RepID=UPI0013E1750A|nr:hypothetical protein [Nordella sp. HKS 07]QIG48262.1 hypothetical protein G5V57_11310 [Nordella sp. HKS 07]
MMNPDSFKRLLSVAILGFLPGQLDAKAQDNQIGQNVRTFCSQYDLGQYHFWECDSTITYAEPANARIFYCKGVHLVVTRAGKVHDISAKAQCALLFDTHPDSRGFTLLDMTEDGLPVLPRSRMDLYPDGVAWVAARNLREIQYCSQFIAGEAGIQNRCVAATFK